MASRERNAEPSALHLSSMHRKDLPPQILAMVTAGDRSPITGVVEFKVTTPEVRCFVKGVLLWCPDAGNPLKAPADYFTSGPPSSKFANTALWLAKREMSAIDGVGMVPVENLLGSFYARSPIPAPGCLGFMFEAKTAAQEIWGSFFIDTSFIGPGTWRIFASADAVDPMTAVEWARVNARFAIQVQAGLTLSNGIET